LHSRAVVDPVGDFGYPVKFAAAVNGDACRSTGFGDPE
jgi:hypothetical protein